jgi:anti-anti-sigma factor
MRLRIGAATRIIPDQCDTALTLTGALDINAAAGVRTALLQYLEQHTCISLDLSQIESCDAAGIQLLLALGKSAEAAGKPLVVVAASDAFTSNSADLGIDGNRFAVAIPPQPGPTFKDGEDQVA